MKHIHIKLLLIAFLLVGMLLPVATASAAGASISMVANKATVSAGSSLVVAVYINGGGTPLNAIQVDLNYPASKLQYVGVNFSGGAFEIGAAAGGGNGAVSIARGTTSTISGSALVGTVTFKALASSGSATIGVSTSSSLVSPNNPTASIPYYGAPKTINFGVVASAPAAAEAPAAPAPPKDTAAPVISEISPSAVTPLSITINWKTNENADSVVEFGLDTNYGLSTSSSTQTVNHVVPLNSTFLTPQTTFHYRVKSTDSAGNVATSPDQSFQLPGIPVTIVVRGPNGKPQAGAVVTIDNASGTTDANGKVVLPSGLGEKKVTTVYQGVSVQKPITVDRTVKTLPPYQLDLSRQPLNHWVLISIALFIIVISLLGIDALLFGSHFFARLAGLRHMPHPSLSFAHQTATSTPSDPSTPVDTTPKNNVADTPTEPVKADVHHLSTAVVPPLSTLSRDTPELADEHSPDIAAANKSESSKTISVIDDMEVDRPSTLVKLKKTSSRHTQHKLKTRSEKKTT